MADQTPNEIIDAETAKIESKLSDSLDYSVELHDSLNDLIEAYDGLRLDDDGCVYAGDRFDFLRLSCDEEVPTPHMLPNIIHGSTIFFLVPSKINWPRHLRNHIFAWLPRSILDQGSIFIPDEKQDLLYATGIDSAGLIETLEDYWSFVAEVTQVREELEANYKERNLDQTLILANADQIVARMHKLQKDFIENKG